MKIFHGDVLKFNMAEVFPSDEGKGWEETPPNFHIIGNLPFGISTPLIVLWLRQMSERKGAWRSVINMYHNIRADSFLYSVQTGDSGR